MGSEDSSSPRLGRNRELLPCIGRRPVRAAIRASAIRQPHLRECECRCVHIGDGAEVQGMHTFPCSLKTAGRAHWTRPPLTTTMEKVTAHGTSIVTDCYLKEILKCCDPSLLGAFRGKCDVS